MVLPSHKNVPVVATTRYNNFIYFKEADKQTKISLHCMSLVMTFLICFYLAHVLVGTIINMRQITMLIARRHMALVEVIHPGCVCVSGGEGVVGLRNNSYKSLKIPCSLH